MPPQPLPPQPLPPQPLPPRLFLCLHISIATFTLPFVLHDHITSYYLQFSTLLAFSVKVKISQNKLNVASMLDSSWNEQQHYF